MLNSKSSPLLLWTTCSLRDIKKETKKCTTIKKGKAIASADCLRSLVRKALTSSLLYSKLTPMPKVFAHDNFLPVSFIVAKRVFTCIIEFPLIYSPRHAAGHCEGTQQPCLPRTSRTTGPSRSSWIQPMVWFPWKCHRFVGIYQM